MKKYCKHCKKEYTSKRSTFCSRKCYYSHDVETPQFPLQELPEVKNTINMTENWYEIIFGDYIPHENELPEIVRFTNRFIDQRAKDRAKLIRKLTEDGYLSTDKIRSV